MQVPPTTIAITITVNNQPVQLHPATTPTAAVAVAAAEWQPVSIACTPPAGAALALVVEGAGPPEPLAPFLHPDDPAWHWHWNPGNRVGRVRLVLTVTWPDGRSSTHATLLNVLPSKVDQHTYGLLLDDLQRTLLSLVVSLRGASAGATLHPLPTQTGGAGPLPPPLAIESILASLEAHLDELEPALQHIARTPHTVLHPASTRVPPGLAHDLSHASDELLQARTASTTHEQSYPADIAQPTSRPTTDTYENRLVKHVLDTLWRCARTVVASADNLTDSAAHRLHHINRRLAHLRATPVLTDVSTLATTTFQGATHIIRHHAGYRTVYRVWQTLRATPWIMLDSPLLTLPVHELPRLYECWCVVKLVAVLLEEASTRGATVIHTLFEPATGTLTEDTPLLLLSSGEETLRLRYQPRYAPPVPEQTAATELCSLDTSTHIPDITLERTTPGQPPAVLVFDAKYRRTSGGSVPQDARADAYTYLGSIGLASGQRAVRASVLLYPGEGTPEHYASGVGVAPLVPGQTEYAAEWLNGLVALLRA